MWNVFGKKWVLEIRPVSILIWEVENRYFGKLQAETNTVFDTCDIETQQ